MALSVAIDGSSSVSRGAFCRAFLQCSVDPQGTAQFHRLEQPGGCSNLRIIKDSPHVRRVDQIPDYRRVGEAHAFKSRFYRDSADHPACRAKVSRAALRFGGDRFSAELAAGPVPKANGSATGAS